MPAPARAARAARVALVALVALAPAARLRAQGIRGFSADALDAQRARERVMVETPAADTLRALLRALSAEPHESGSAGARRVAEAIRDRFRAVGVPAEIEEFRVLLPRPTARALEIVAPERRALSLHEPALGDEPRGDSAAVLPPYNAYAVDGDVTAEVVYANYGGPADYAELERRGVSVKGKIVLVRYGGLWRGAKVRAAAARGAVGCLIYSDPQDEGLGAREFPDGPARPATGVQRGSVVDFHTYAGDPLTPFRPSVPGEPRLPRDSAVTLAPLPTLPISYGEARPILAGLGGPRGGEGWRGGLDVPYALGPGPIRVRLRLTSDWAERPLYDVIARIEGAAEPERLVVFGNHHDAWVYGARDPISGMVGVLEAARGLGRLLATGWRPRRTIVLAAWDGEEWGLLGSTEWVEKHRGALARGGVAYINTDGAESGVIGAVGASALADMVREVLRDVKRPESGQSLIAERAAFYLEQEAMDATWNRFKRLLRYAVPVGLLLGALLVGRSLRRARRAGPARLRRALLGLGVAAAVLVVSAAGALAWSRANPLDARRLRARASRGLRDHAAMRAFASRSLEARRAQAAADTGFVLAPPGGTSDYVPFLGHVGVPVVFYFHSGESTLAGDYHSRHDTFAFYERFIDPTLRGARTQAVVVGVTLLRLADAPLLPYEYGALARVLGAHLHFTRRAAEAAGLAAEADLAGLGAARDTLAAAALRYDEAALAAQRRPGFGGADGLARVARANDVLVRAERAFIDPAGLPGRPWYRHLLYAPERDAAMTAAALPGVSDALRRRDAPAARREAARARAAVLRLAALVDSAAAALGPASR